MASKTVGATPKLAFHNRVFGKNIQLKSNGLAAFRTASFDNAIVFSNRPIQANEHIFIEIVHVEEASKWLAAFALGFTTANPDRINQNDLKSSSTSSITKNNEESLMRSLTTTFRNGVILELYFNNDGAFCKLDGREIELSASIPNKKELWAVIDIRGDVTEVKWTTLPEQNNTHLVLLDKYNKKPQMLPIKYFTSVPSNFLEPVKFFGIHGREVELLCDNKVVFRRNVVDLCRPYAFIDFPMGYEDELYIRVLSIDTNYRMMGHFGLTNANVKNILNDFNKLPSGDPNGLLDRSEFWIIVDNLFENNSQVLDEYRIRMDKSGTFYVWRNGEADALGRVISYSDGDLKYYPFFYLDGRINSVALFGCLSKDRQNNQKPIEQETSADNDDDSSLCQLCLSFPANCLLVPCHHAYFCTECKEAYEAKYRQVCPCCRRTYEQIIEISTD